MPALLAVPAITQPAMTPAAITPPTITQPAIASPTITQPAIAPPAITTSPITQPALTPPEQSMAFEAPVDATTETMPSVMPAPSPPPPAPVEQASEARPDEASAERERPSTAEALAALDAILDGVEAQLSSFARLAPQRQRTSLLVWICRARSFEDALPHERDVHRRIGVIARRLSDLAKTFWPGSVRALQLTARPWDLSELRTRGASAPRSWAEGAQRADRVLADQLAEAERQGLDADGWAEDPNEPAMDGSPDQVLSSASTAITSVLGPLRDADEPETLDPAAIDTLANAARRLRRVRRRVVDGVAWGVVIGRLRRLAPALGAKGVRLRDALDPKVPLSRSR
ncbi:Hypothetical protein A7982_10685 [Minicystis rosea]|nr:Hypothetical protein A7982_10685 [Minicystis rosea]